MKLLGTVGSPYVRKVRIVAEEKRIPYDNITASPSDPNSGVQTANPLGKIPVLIRDDGITLYDSSVIVEYFDGVGTERKLIPDTFADRIQVKRWEALGDGIADATVDIGHDQRMPVPEQKGEVLYTKQKKKIDDGLTTMEKDLGSQLFCHGKNFTLADIACGVALGYLDHALPQFNWLTPLYCIRALSARVVSSLMPVKPSVKIARMELHAGTVKFTSIMTSGWILTSPLTTRRGSTSVCTRALALGALTWLPIFRAGKGTGTDCAVR